VQYTEFMGDFGQTRVLNFDSPNQDITGDVAVIVIVPEPASALLLVSDGTWAMARRRGTARH